MFMTLVRRMQSDEKDKDGSSCSSFSTATSSPSCVVESDMIERNEMVTVNKNCVNIDYANNDDSNKMKNIIRNDDSNNEKEIVNSILLAATALDEFDRQLNDGLLSTSLAIEKNQDDEILSKFNNLIIHDGDNENHGNVNDDDEATSSSKYSDVMYRRCEMSSTSALSHVAHYTPTPDNNRNHRKAVRKNFSLWIGVTSCVWACLVWLMKNYA